MDDYNYNQDLNYENEQENLNDNEDEEDDNYLQELYLKLAEMKKERKEAQKNAQILDNRINMLKNEEEKRWKNIENKKKKVNEKYIYLKNVADNMKQLENAKLKKEKEIEEKKQNNQKLKNEIKNGKEKKKIEKQNQINEDAKLLKLQRQYNEQLIEFLNNEKITNNKSKCDIIKSQHSIEKEKTFRKRKKSKIKRKIRKTIIRRI